MMNYTFKWLFATASCKGRIPSTFSQLTLALAFNNSTITSLHPLLAALWSGVQPEKGKKRNKRSYLQINTQVVSSLLSLFSLMEWIYILIQMYILSTGQEIILKTGYVNILWAHSCPWTWPCPPEGPGPRSSHRAHTLDPGHPGPCSQSPWSPVLPTNGWGPAPETPGPKPCPSAGLL